ncbi:hypothetical protein ACFLYU_04730 [Candidatus Dependentiae bacterium]
MNRALKYLLVLALMTNLTAFSADCCNTCCNTCNTCCNSCDDCCDDCSYLGQCDGYPFLQIRSQGRDSARELVGWQEFINKYDADSHYGAFSVAVEYSRSFRNDRLTHFYFGNDLVNCCKLMVQGSAVADRNSKAWLADYFGLSPKFKSELTFCPEIQNAVVDLAFYWGASCETAEGLFVRVNAPIVWTKWSLCPCEKVCDVGEDGFDAGYMHEDAVARADLANSLMQVMCGGYKFGDMQSPICYSRFNKGCCTETRLGEIDFTLGYNFHLEEDRHFGLFAYVAAPAGNRPCGKYLFEPIVGNGKHWELGGGLTGSWIFWRSEECEDRYMGVWLEATVAHLFKACQCRSFDFKCKPNSRYMLLEEMGTNDDVIQGEVSGTSTTAAYQYKKNLIPAVNWSTFNVDVRIPVVADIAVKLGYVKENWSFDLGYNLWARTGEKFCDCCCKTNKKYAFKGDAFIYGAEGDAGDGDKYALSATQSLATIRSGKNFPAVNADNPKQNPRIDNPFLAERNGTDLYIIGDTNRINTSVEPILVNKCMLNLGKSPSSITHKIFAHFGYAWKDRECDDYVPFIGIGGKAEFAQDNYKDCCCCDSCCNDCCGCNSCDSNCGSCGSCCDSCCDDCCGCGSCCNDNCCSRRGGVSLWGIWVKGGVAFD